MSVTQVYTLTFRHIHTHICTQACTPICTRAYVHSKHLSVHTRALSRLTLSSQLFSGDACLHICVDRSLNKCLDTWGTLSRLPLSGQLFSGAKRMLPVLAPPRPYIGWRVQGYTGTRLQGYTEGCGHNEQRHGGPVANRCGGAAVRWCGGAAVQRCSTPVHRGAAWCVQ